MESQLVVVLTVIAASSFVQMCFLIAVAWGGFRLAQRLKALQDRLDREIRPAVETFSRIARNLAEVSDLAVLQARRVDDILADTANKFEEVSDTLRRFILRPLRPLVDIAAFIHGLRRGLETYQHLGGLEAQGRGRARRYGEEDEHLFI